MASDTSHIDTNSGEKSTTVNVDNIHPGQYTSCCKNTRTANACGGQNLDVATTARTRVGRMIMRRRDYNMDAGKPRR